MEKVVVPRDVPASYKWAFQAAPVGCRLHRGMNGTREKGLERFVVSRSQLQAVDVAHAMTQKEHLHLWCSRANLETRSRRTFPRCNPNVLSDAIILLPSGLPST
jgi:hypothetical protein